MKDEESGRGEGMKDEVPDLRDRTKAFALRIIKHVGNYGEIYDRNMGTKTPLKLPRGQNQLWNQGGLLYSPPFR